MLCVYYFPLKQNMPKTRYADPEPRRRRRRKAAAAPVFFGPENRDLEGHIRAINQRREERRNLYDTSGKSARRAMKRYFKKKGSKRPFGCGTRYNYIGRHMRKGRSVVGHCRHKPRR